MQHKSSFEEVPPREIFRGICIIGNWTQFANTMLKRNCEDLSSFVRRDDFLSVAGEVVVGVGVCGRGGRGAGRIKLFVNTLIRKNDSNPIAPPLSYKGSQCNSVQLVFLVYG